MRLRLHSACALALASAAGTAGCGEDAGERPGTPRPAAALTVTAAILPDGVQVAPRRFGAGAIRLLVSNQTAIPRTLTFETAGTRRAGITQSTSPIAPMGTATLEVDVPRGDYELRVRGAAPARVRAGRARRSAQDSLRQP